MKVLHVIDELGDGGGAEQSLTVLLPLLRERGVDSSVACLRNRPDGGFQAELQEQGFEVRALPPGRLAGARELRRRVTRERPQLVHSTLVHSCLTSRMALAGLGVTQLNSLVNTTYDPVRIHALGIAPWKIRVLRGVDGATARRLVGHFHVISETVRREAVEVLRVRPESTILVPRGRDSVLLGRRSDERNQRVRSELGLPADALVCLNVGRQDGQKAQDLLIRAFADVRRRVPRAVLLVAGREGDATPRVQQAVADTCPGDSVRLLGHRTDIADLCAAADVFVFPSHYEGLGCAVLEAMALSTAIVGSDAPAVREVLEDGRLGRVVPRGDVDALADAVVELLTDRRTSEVLGGRARAAFEERYELSRVADATLEMYEQVVSRAGR